MSKDKESVANLIKAVEKFGLHAAELNYIEKDALSNIESTQFHNTDRTPVIFDPTLGDGQGGPREFCFAGQAMDIGGKSRTSGDGKMRWKLSNYFCERGRIFVDEPVAFVATARSTSPVTMTSNTASVGTDLEIDVFSWDAGGNPAKDVRFSWRCWFNFPPIIDG